MARGPKAVANQLLYWASRARSKIDPLQMQKLVYLCQGWTLGLTSEPLFTDPLEAWRYGPVSPELYHSLKLFGDSAIIGRLKEFDFKAFEVVDASADFEDLEEQIIEAVWKKYGNWGGPRLIALTHLEGSPWDKTRKSNPGENGARIPNELMLEWFEEEAEKASLINAG